MWAEVYRAMLPALGMLMGLSVAQAQKSTTITIRVLDGKTGTKVDASNVLVQFDHRKDVDSFWRHENDDGSLEVAVPPGAREISVHATYDNAMEFYIDCDVAKQKNTSMESWYPLADILKSGIVMPNDCVKEKQADKIHIDAKPGEFDVYVRRRNWREQD